MTGIFEFESLTFQEPSRTTDSGGRTDTEWTNALTMDGRVRVNTVGVFSEVEQGTVQVAEYTVYVKGTPDIHHGMRILWGDKILKIVDSVNKYSHHLEIKCKLDEDNESITTTTAP